MRTTWKPQKSKTRTLKERGSLALEQILFIGAVAVMGVGVWAFYGNLSTYFATFKVQSVMPNSDTTSGKS